MKKKVLLTSILTILLCLCLISGSTFALFQSVVTADIKVTAGQVVLYANMDNTSLALTSRGHVMNGNKFANGGEVYMAGNSMQIWRATPGDAASFKIKVDDYSNVAVQYKVSAEMTGGLANALEVKAVVNGNTYTMTPTATGFETGYIESIGDSVTVTVTFPYECGNEFQNNSADIVFTIEAIQANAA